MGSNACTGSIPVPGTDKKSYGKNRSSFFIQGSRVEKGERPNRYYFFWFVAKLICFAKGF